MDKRMLEVKKAGAYDFALALATIAIFAALSAISIFGTVQSWLNSVSNPEWSQSIQYADYLNQMNAYAYPFAVALVLVLCMCIPKRFIPRTYLLQSSIILLSFSAVIGVVWGLVAGLGFLLFVSALLQAAVAVLVVARSKNLVFEREGLMVQLGSALLHLGLVVFALDLLAIREVQSHLSVFWLSTILITLGSILCFYSREITLGVKRLSGQEITGPAITETPAYQESLMPSESQPAQETLAPSEIDS